MTTEELIAMATNSRNLNTQSHLLSVTYHIPAKEANSLILTRFYERVHDRDIQPDKVDWIVTFSRKDVQRTLGNEASYHNQHVSDGVEMDDITNPSIKVATELSDEVLRAIFKDDRSREFVQSILSSGKEETMSSFGLTKQQFNSRLNHRIKYCHDHSALINRVLATDERKALIKQQRLIKVLLDDVDSPLLADDNDLNTVIRTLFNYHPVLHDWLEDCKESSNGQLHYEREVVNDFTGAGRDSRLFICYLYGRLNEINTQLKGSNNND